ncbi:MAG: hypothetical protein ACJAT2_002649 [Bacteriovoracaceae bacterium]|jgi:hypothetical protein
MLDKNRGVPQDEVQFKLIKQIQKLEKRTNKLRLKKSNSEPAINLMIWKKIAKYDALLANNSYSQITRELRPLFREVETAVVIIKKYEAILDTIKRVGIEDREILKLELEGISISDELIEAVLERTSTSGMDLNKIKAYYKSVIDENSIHLGHFYHEYKLVRLHFENMMGQNSCSDSCKLNIKKLLDSIGVASNTDQQRYGIFLRDAKRPSWLELSESLNSHPLAYTTRLKRERDEEFKLFLKGLIAEVLPFDELAQVILNAPGISKSKAIRVIKLFYDRIARLVHFPKVNQIMRSSQEAAEKFDLFLQLNTTVIPQDELMVTFARRIDSQTKAAWSEMIKFAKNNQEAYPDILKRMEQAKEKAMARGEISLVHEKSFTTRLAIILSAGGSFAYYHFNKKEVEEVIDEVGHSSTEVDPELEVTSEEKDEQDLGESTTLLIKHGSKEDKALDQLIDELNEISKDLALSQRGPNSVNETISSIRFIKEVL